MEEIVKEVIFYSEERKKIPHYKARDGKVFSKRERCLSHEEGLTMLEKAGAKYKIIDFDPFREIVTRLAVYIHHSKHFWQVQNSFRLLHPYCVKQELLSFTPGWNILHAIEQMDGPDYLEVENIMTHIDEVTTFIDRLEEEGILQSCASKEKISGLLEDLKEAGEELH